MLNESPGGKKGVNSAEISSPDLRAIVAQSFKKALGLLTQPNRNSSTAEKGDLNKQ